MKIIRIFLNWLRTFSGVNRAALKVRAKNALAELRRLHEKVIAGITALEPLLASELRYKAALARIDVKLLELTNDLLAAEAASDRQSADRLAAMTAQWEMRAQSCESALNLVRRRVNASRHGAANLAKDASRVATHLRDLLAGARPIWAITLRMIADSLVDAIARERRCVAALMTRSAIVHDGRDPSSSLARLRRLGLARKRVGADDVRAIVIAGLGRA